MSLLVPLYIVATLWLIFSRSPLGSSDDAPGWHQAIDMMLSLLFWAGFVLFHFEIRDAWVLTAWRVVFPCAIVAEAVIFVRDLRDHEPYEELSEEANVALAVSANVIYLMFMVPAWWAGFRLATI
ncbi:MAG: hypothetical protein AAGD38_21020 [Acidobacteriota bacterium]